MDVCLSVRSWRYTSTCSKCDGPGSRLQSGQDKATHDFMMELFEMIPLTFWDLGRKGIWQSLIQCFNLLQPFCQCLSWIKIIVCPGRKGIKAVAQPSVTSGRPLESSSNGTCLKTWYYNVLVLPSSPQKWCIYMIQAFYERIVATNTNKYDIRYIICIICIILYHADQDILL